MAHFNFNKEIDELTSMDGPLTSKGTQMRWQRKASTVKAPPETLLRVHAADGGMSSPLRSLRKNSTAITPGKGKTPNAKTPSGARGADFSNVTKSGKKAKTPGAKTPGKNLEDRFIPNRKNSCFEYGHYAVMKNEEDGEADEAKRRNSNDCDYQERLKDAMDVRDRKILSYQSSKPPVSQGSENLHVLYTKTMGPKATSTRHIPQEPERVLDAPELMDDYYLNLLDWSANNLFAVALGNAIFLWNAESGDITHLMDLTTEGQYFSSVSWVQEGAVLAVGVSSGVIQLWDTEQQKLMRSMGGHAARVGALAWNEHILSSGSRSGAIHHHDVRVANHQVATLTNHTQEVCGLRWSPDGNHLASGGNDNMVNVWSQRGGSGEPLHNFSSHQAAVKALAWCPWQQHILATGGGTADRCIRLWNVQNGVSLGQTDTGSQVCSILWSEPHKELISGHGYSLNHLRIWKYPSMTRVADLVGHQSRILCMTMSPDGTTVASAAADETIRLWKCFDVPKKTRKMSRAGKSKEDLTSDLHKMCLR